MGGSPALASSRIFVNNQFSSSKKAIFLLQKNNSPRKSQKLDFLTLFDCSWELSCQAWFFLVQSILKVGPISSA